MDRSKTVELMPIVWRLGTGKAYLDHPRAKDLSAVAAMGGSIQALLEEWREDDCCILRRGAAAALGHLEQATARRKVLGVAGRGTAALAPLI